MSEIDEIVRLAEIGANQLSCCPPNMLVSESQRAIRALISRATETCEWRQGVDYSYDTGCGVMGAMIFASGWTHCPHCGKRLTETKHKEV